MRVDFDTDLASIPDPFRRELDGETLPAVPHPKASSPSRSGRRALVTSAACGSVLYEGAGLVLRKVRPDLGKVSTVLLGVEFALPLAVAAFALAGARRKGRFGLGEPIARLGVGLLGSLLFFVAGTLVFFPLEDRLDGAFWSRTQACLLTTAVLGAGPVTLAALALRSSFVSAAGWRTAAVGVAAGALGASTMALVCPARGALHLLVGHGAMMLVMGLFAAAFVSRITRI